MSKPTQPVNGYGDRRFMLAVYIGNRPDIDADVQQTGLRPLMPGEISHIVAHTGNHWRKIFTIFAKLMFALSPGEHASWQDYRDRALLQAGNGHALLFSTPQRHLGSEVIHIITGKTYAQALGFWQDCEDIGEGFFINRQQRLIVTPYFDYRQLSNIKLEQLKTLIADLHE